MTHRVLRKTIFLKAPPEQVWEYLTEPEHLAKWFHAPHETLAEGRPLALFGTTSGDKLIWGTVLQARAPEYLEYTFTVKPMGDAVSNVKWWLEPVPGGTQLRMEHSGLSPSEDAFGLTLALDNGWDEHFMQLRTAITPQD